MVHRPKFCRSQEAWTDRPWVSVSGSSLGASSGGHWPARLPSLRATSFLLLQTPASGKKQGRAGPALWGLAHPRPQAPAELKRSSASGFRAPAVWPRPPHPTSRKSLSQQAEKIRRAILGSGKEKPQQLPPNWHSKQLEAPKGRNELNKLFSPFRVEYRLQVSTQVTP